MKHSDFKCPDCGGSGIKKVKLEKIKDVFLEYTGTTVSEIITEPCPSCKGSPTLRAKVTGLEVKDNLLIEWSEI